MAGAFIMLLCNSWASSSPGEGFPKRSLDIVVGREQRERRWKNRWECNGQGQGWTQTQVHTVKNIGQPLSAVTSLILCPKRWEWFICTSEVTSSSHWCAQHLNSSLDFHLLILEEAHPVQDQTLLTTVCPWGPQPPWRLTWGRGSPVSSIHSRPNLCIFQNVTYHLKCQETLTKKTKATLLLLF